MGRLAGFSADEVIRKLRRAGFIFNRQAKGSHEYGGTPKLVPALLCLTILVSFPRGHCVLSCVKLGSA